MYDRIRGDVAAGRIAPVYLLMGAEGYFIDSLADLLADKLLPEEQRAFNQTIVYGKDVEAGAVVNLCRQMPMMGGRQVVIVREAQQMKKLDQLSLYTASPGATTVLVLCHKEKAIDKRLQLYKQIAAAGVVFESVAPYDSEIGGWLSDHIRSRGCTIEPQALRMLTDNLGVDIAKIANELTKLLTFLPEGTVNITADHVENNIGISKEFNTYELTRALSERNASKAMLIATHFARNPKDNPLIVTLSTLFTHFQRIFTLNYLGWSARNRGQAMPSDMEISRLLKLPNPFFLGEYKQAAALYPNKKVFAILGLIRQYDLRAKGLDNGNTSEGELMKELLLKIFAL